jgi:hypothetical protein
MACALCIITVRPVANSCLGSASDASGGGSSLGLGRTGVGLGTLLHHNGKGDITTLGVFVSGLPRVDTRRIWAVSLPGLEGVEVEGTAWGAGVPRIVDFHLGVVVPHLVVVLSVVTVEFHRSTNTKGGGREGRSGGHKGEKSNNVGVLRCRRTEEEKGEKGSQNTAMVPATTGNSPQQSTSMQPWFQRPPVTAPNQQAGTFT